MKDRELITSLKVQIRQSSEREKSLLEQIDRQSAQIGRQSAQIDLLSRQFEQQSVQLELQAMEIKNLTATIQSMEEAMKLRDSNIASLKEKNRALVKLLGNKSEKIAVDTTKTEDVPPGADNAPEATEAVEKPKKEKPRFNPKDRGNNNAKRKEFFDTVIELVEIWKQSLKTFIPAIPPSTWKSRK